jgi:predicted dehydrogenase
MQPVRTALIGCGKVGTIHAQALASLAESKFVAACDADPARAQAFASRYNIEPFDSVEQMLAHVAPDAVTICTPHPLHEQPTVLAASAGVHVLVEKPLASSLAACDRMIAAAEKSGVNLGVISQRRLLEPVQRMKAAIDAGKIGAPILGVLQMFSWRDEAYYRSDPWRGKWSTEGGGVLVNQSAHHLELLQWFMGPIDEISGYWANLNHPYIEVDDTALAMIRFKSGALGSIVTSISQKPGVYAKIHVHGSSGASVGVETDSGATFVAGMTSVAAPPLNDLWTIPGEEHLFAEFQATDRDRFSQIDATTYYHAMQIQDFLHSICENRPPLVTGRDGRTVVEMFTAIYRSNEQRHPIKFPVS